jgi:hypothetical protein
VFTSTFTEPAAANRWSKAATCRLERAPEIRSSVLLPTAARAVTKTNIAFMPLVVVLADQLSSRKAKRALLFALE